MASQMKGISPLIASVLLIAFTMAIAGIMATWTTTFSRERLSVASQESECVGVLDLSSLDYSGGQVSVRLRNVGSINLTGLKGTLEYTNAASNQVLNSLSGVPDPFQPGATAFVTIPSATKPNKIEVFATNCAKYPSILFFR